MNPWDDGSDEQAAQIAAAMAGLPYRQQALQAKMRRAGMLAGTQQPQGREVGRTFVASSPLEHIAAAMSRYVGMRDARQAEDAFAPLAHQAEQAGALQGRLARQDKQFGQAIQLGGLKRQQEADAATREHQAATLALQQQDAARKAEADKAEAAYRSGMLGVQREGLGLRRQEIDATKAAKAAADAERAKGAQMKGAEELRKEFQGLGAYKNTQTVAESYRKIQSTGETGPGDMSLIFAYMKMLDPGSTVREGEYATAQNAGSIPQNIVASYNRAVGGEKLAPEVRKQFRDQAKSILKAQASLYEDTAKPYRRLAEAQGLAPEDVVLDLGLGSLLGPPAPAQGAAPASAPQRMQAKDGKWYVFRNGGWEAE